MRIPKSHRCLLPGVMLPALLLAKTAAQTETELFADTFNAANGGFDSASTAGRVTGLLANETYLRSFGTDQSITNNRVALLYPGSNTPGGGLRFELATNDPVSGASDRYNWAGGLAASSILAGGGMKITYDWIPTTASNTEWHGWSFGTENNNSGDTSRVNNSDTDYGILIRQNGGTQRFDSGSSLGNGGGISTSSNTSYPVSIELSFTSFADGEAVNAVTTLNGTQVANDNFQWSGNAGAIRFEIGCNVTGHLIDNLRVTTTGPPPVPVFAMALEGNAFGSNDPAGTTIGSLSATLDGQPQDSTYALVAGAGDDDNGLFQIDGDQLEVATDFSGPGHVDGQTFSVRIEGTSAGVGGETDVRAYALTLHKEDEPGSPPVFPPGAHAPGAPTDLRVDDAIGPVGTSDAPYFGWQVNDSDPNEIQSAYQILAASTAADLAADNGDLWDSGQVNAGAQNHIAYDGTALAGDQQVFWKIRTWDRDGNVSPYSAPATFVVGLLGDSDWSGAQWIRRDSTDSDDYSYYRHKSTLPDKAVERATVYVSSAHKYALYLNETLVGKGPAYHYPEHQYYNAYDITGLVEANAVNQFALFNHWFGGGQGRPAGGRGVILKAIVRYTDGSSSVIGTDGTWLQSRASAWVLGQSQRNSGEGVGYIELIDSRLMTPDWFAEAFNDSSWSTATAIGAHPVSPWTGTLAPDLSRIVETEVTVEPASITALSGNRYVIDLGRVRSGVPRIRFSGGSSGTTIQMRGGYALTGTGAIDTSMSQSTDMSFRTILNGGSFTYEPVEYLGMRYFQIDSPPMVVTSENFTFIERHSAMDTSRSSFDSSDPALNAAWDLMKQSLLTCAQEEFVDTPTREKGGFLGDAAIQSTVAMPVMNERLLTRRTLHEFLQSMDQHWSGTGRVNAVYPNNDGARDIPDYTQAYLTWVWNYYMETGDRAFLAANYPKFEAIANYVHAHRDTTTGLITNLSGGSGAYQYGIVDWPATMRFGYDMTAARTVINGWAFADYDVMAKIAAELGNTADRNLWWGRADDLEASMNSQLINGGGVYVDGVNSGGSPSTHVSQHANMFPLALGIVPAAQKTDVIAKVKELEMSVGMVTLPWLIRAIGEAEEGEHLIDLFTDNTWTYGYADILSKGATATWESWDADTTGQSMSHAWGAAGLEGYLRYILGVKPLKPQSGEIQIKPLDFGTSLARAEGSMATDRGDVAVQWERSVEAYRLDVSLPVNILATVAVPKGASPDPKVFVDGFEVTGTIEGDFIRVPWIGSGNHTIVRVDGTAKAIDAWRVHHFGLDWLSNPEADDDMDPDADGLTNRVEYGLGFDPLAGSAHLLPKPVFQGGDITIAYPVPRAEIHYTIRGTEDLTLAPTDWDVLPSTTEGTGADTLLRATVSMAGHPAYFIRLFMVDP
ncbi:MAG: family 78 glycoside hydrolase catalytic domain [Verrucomicrobiae bacterium]|nr:family 78 glycoside hydrolase catalytic domain [Verrucomicrobiae bacterium]MCP5547581.1 family 78 glycoside hydrolase catalytic domain [Akkermansiaceae bacterium]